MNTTDDYMQNSQGHMVPKDLVSAIDLQRHELVQEIIGKALAAQAHIREFKKAAMNDVQAFVELSAEQYGAKLGGIKGNVTLTSYDGKYKIQRAIAEYLHFDERLQVAKELIDECIRRWAAGTRPEIRALVDHAFQTDSAGNISTTRVLGLKQLDIQDEQWRKAMQAITDSIQITGSKAYLRIYKRIEGTDQWQSIPLDIAAL